MITPPVITESAARQTACLPLTVARSEIAQVMGPGLMELMAALKDQGIAPSGPWFAHHLKMDPGSFDFEICIPVDTPVTKVGRVKPGSLRAATVARTVYSGPYEGLHGAWSQFDQWMTAQGIRRASDLWEVYLVGPESGPDSSQWRTELNRPLAD